MGVLKRVKIFLFLDKKTKLMFIEAFILLGWARILKKRSFSEVTPLLGEQMKETSFSRDEINRKLLAQISQAVHIMSKYTFGKANVL